MKDIKIENFNELEVKIDYVPILKKYAEKCKELVEQKSPVRTGKYKKGWRAVEDKDYLGNVSVVVWNETDWQLTHLLENGHAIVNKKGGVGRASPHKHIAPSYRAVRNGFIKDIENVKLNIIAK